MLGVTPQQCLSGSGDGAAVYTCWGAAQRTHVDWTSQLLQWRHAAYSYGTVKPDGGNWAFTKTSWKIEAARYGLRVVWSLWNSKAPRQQCCRGACQISEWYNHCKTRSRRFDILRDQAVRPLVTLWIKQRQTAPKIDSLSRILIRVYLLCARIGQCCPILFHGVAKFGSLLSSFVDILSSNP